ncbi:hypothetical protein LA6_003435 [Marinibacterium anthonyi]|nr:hypothetical protein LA6_003435 [Marinibacterium anthonyi]
MIDAVTARLESLIPELDRRVDGAAEFTRLMETKKLPSGGVRAYVLPTGIRGQRGDALAGAFTQPIVRTLAVVLLTRSVDAAGERALTRLNAFVDEIITALAGWAPSDEVGVFELRLASIIPTETGLLGYQIEFSITDQLRILS